MEGILRKLFNLYPGEGHKVALLSLLGFLWAFGAYGVMTLGDGLFLETIGPEALPTAYAFMALSLCVMATLLLFGLARFSIHKILLAIILFSICFYGGGFLMCAQGLNPPWFYAVLKVGAWVIAISTYIAFWAFIDQYYDLQDGKRFFAFLNAILFLGDACGGGVISLLLGPLEMGHIFLLFTVTTALSLPFLFIIHRQMKPVFEESVQEVSSLSTFSFPKMMRRIIKSPFTLVLMLFYFLMQVLAIMTEYTYMDDFAHRFGGAHQLTKFLGTTTAWVSLGNLFFCLFFYSRLIKRMGVNNIILIAPLFFLMIFSFWLGSSALSIAVLGLVAREGMVYSFDDNNLNLLITGVPSRVRNQVRVAIESFLEPVGMLSTALLLSLFRGWNLAMGIGISFVALGVAFFLRSHYPRALFTNLVENTLQFKQKASDWIGSLSKKQKSKVEFYLLATLKRGDEKGRLMAYESLLKMQHRRFLPRLLDQLSNLSIPGKVTAIELLSESSFAKEVHVIERLERWRRSQAHPAIRSAVHFYFARHGFHKPDQIVKDLDHPHLGLHGAAILTLKNSSEGGVHKTEAEERLERLLHSSEEQEVCMGLYILGFDMQEREIEPLLPYLTHPSPHVNRSAARSLASISHPDLKSSALRLTRMLGLMRDPETRSHCLEAIGKMHAPECLRDLIVSSIHMRPSERKYVQQIALSFGEEVIPTLLSLVQEESIHVRARLLAGKILGKRARSRLRPLLYPLIHTEIKRAYFYFYHLHTIQKQVPHHNLGMLESALESSYHSVIDFIIQLLGTVGEIEESDVLAHSLWSPNKKSRAQAVEMLQKTCDTKIFQLLEPLIHDWSAEEKLQIYLANGGIPYKLNQLLETLEHSSFLSDQIVAITLKARFNTPDWKEAVRQKMQSQEEIFQHLASELL